MGSGDIVMHLTVELIDAESTVPGAGPRTCSDLWWGLDPRFMMQYVRARRPCHQDMD